MKEKDSDYMSDCVLQLRNVWGDSFDKFMQQNIHKLTLRSFSRNKIKQDFCQTCTSYYLSCNIFKCKIKSIGHQVRLRDIVMASYPIIPSKHMFI